MATMNESRVYLLLLAADYLRCR